MKLSTKGRYGVAVMYELALQYGNGPMSLKEIAQNQGISKPYLEQLVSTLRNTGFVTSVRGAQGGYMLTRSPDQITVGDIITAMEGPIALVDCLMDHKVEGNSYCEKAGSCVARNVWARVCDSIKDVLYSISLADLCKEKILKGDDHNNEKGLF